jgi:hypothetical protein
MKGKYMSLAFRPAEETTNGKPKAAAPQSADDIPL